MGPRSRERVEAIAEACGHIVAELRQQRATLREILNVSGRTSDDVNTMNGRLGETLASHEKQNTLITGLERRLSEHERELEEIAARLSR